jgi:uncharacterized membrane protein YgdD (TMEM256/DUF423 family)
MFHSIALLAISAHPRLMHKRFAAGAIALGSAMFSGSIYGMILLKMRGFQNSGKVLGPVTPLGGIHPKGSSVERLLILGLLMIAGWTALIF